MTEVIRLADRQARRQLYKERLRADAERAEKQPLSEKPGKRRRQELHARRTAMKAKRSYRFDFSKHTR